jgi:hypothetical protein
MASAITLCCMSSHALVPELHCRLERGTTILQTTQKPVTDPYRLAPIPAGPGFAFKALVLEHQSRVTQILIHAYHVRNGVPRLLHQAIYTRPVVPTVDLTGEQVVIEPDLGRELRYRCGLLEGTS